MQCYKKMLMDVGWNEEEAQGIADDVFSAIEEARPIIEKEHQNPDTPSKG